MHTLDIQEVAGRAVRLAEIEHDLSPEAGHRHDDLRQFTNRYRVFSNRSQFNNGFLYRIMMVADKQTRIVNMFRVA